MTMDTDIVLDTNIQLDVELQSIELQSTTCGSFSTTNTNDAATNYQSCNIDACAGEELLITTCPASGGACSGNTYLRLFSGSSATGGTELASNDDSSLNAAL
ncbi:hypothetical protein B484DRAFT_406459 [Ochromonadaceae sp. CCMP2298]|nr:hypothetical protein B484DRAFT_406459 [Ochromonadaceae sp. CCMP2298]